MGAIAYRGKIYGGGGASSADKVSYDNSRSGLEATDSQGAIDEVNAKADSLKKMAQSFETVDAMNAAITAGTVPDGAVCYVGG